ncbi:glycosyltransferase, partial [Patescibacteria group bacterium]|nr:glycosyltransferase [Patescibacteria group bacterium]
MNVSIILPTRNRARLLKKSIESILKQTYLNFELVVIDDGSTDQTPEVVRSFKDKRIRYFRHKKSRGAAAARNMGIKKAKGKLIAFNDDDDIWDKKKLEKQVKAFAKASPEVGVVYTRVKKIKGKEIKYFPEEVVGEKGKREGKIQKELFLENFVDLPTAMIKRECFNKVGLFNEKISRYEDWELFLRMSKHFHFKYLSQTLVKSFILPTGLTSKKELALKDSEIIFQKHKKEIKKDKEILAAWQFRLGDLYYHQGKMRKARNSLRQAFNNQPSFKYFRAIIKTFLGKGISEILIGWKIRLVENWQLLAILVSALFLRLINLNQSLWLDEAVQAITSQGSFSGIFQELRGDFHPPLYHVLMWFWVHLFGSSEIILRLPSVLFGTATVYVACLIGKVVSEQWLVVSKKQNQPPATNHQPLPLLAAIFMATAPFHIYYSQEARNYALTTFLAALSMYYFIRVVSEQWLVVSKKQNQPPTTSHQPLIGYLLSTTLLLYTNYFGLFILLAQALVVAIRREWRQLRMIFYCLLLFAPDLILLRTQLLTGHQATASLPEWGRLVNVNFLKALPLTFIKFSIGRITIFNKKIYAAVAGILLAFYGTIVSKGLFSKKKPLVLLSWLIVPIGCAWLLSFFIPNYQPFRLLLVLPAFYLLLTWGISQIRTTTIRIMVVILILLVNLVSVSVYYINPYFHREDWQGLVQFIEWQPKEEKVAILPSYNSYWPYEYYSPKKVPLVGLSDGFRMVEERDLEQRLQHYSESTSSYIRYLVPMF